MSANILQFRQPACHDPDEIYSSDVSGVIFGETEGEGDFPLDLYVAANSDGSTSFIVGCDTAKAYITLTGEQARQLARSILGQVTP